MRTVIASIRSTLFVINLTPSHILIHHMNCRNLKFDIHSTVTHHLIEKEKKEKRKEEKKRKEKKQCIL